MSVQSSNRVKTHKSQQTLAVPDGTTAARETHKEDESPESDEDESCMLEIGLVGVDDVNVVLQIWINKDPDSYSQNGRA